MRTIRPNSHSSIWCARGSVGSILVVALALLIAIQFPVQAQSSADTVPDRNELRQTIDDLRLQLAQQEERIAELENEKGLDRPVHPTVERLRRTVTELKKTIRRQENELSEYENLTERQEEKLRQARRERKQRMKELQKKLSDVQEAKAEREGQEMTITLDNAILFPLGRAELKKSAQSTLNQITTLLVEYDDYRIFVEGHTDNVPVNSDKFSSNWALSAQRAVNVTEHLDGETRIDGDRLVAAGLGKYQPVVPNTSAENRARNRRVEIKLVPIKTLQAEEELSSTSDTEDV